MSAETMQTTPTVRHSLVHKLGLTQVLRTADRRKSAMKTFWTLAIAFVAVLAFARESESALIVLDLGGVADADIGGDGQIDFSVVIDIAGTDGDVIDPIAASSRVVIDSADTTKRIRRATDSLTFDGGDVATSLNTVLFDILGVLASGGATIGDDNWMGIQFSDSNISGGATLFGVMQINIVANDDAEILRIIYEDDGSGIALGDAVLAVQGSTGNPVPEPSTLALFGMGMLGLHAARRRKCLRHRASIAAWRTHEETLSPTQSSQVHPQNV